ncbi:hypothetical protein [Moorena sp. SIOASIH]|uniref:hypothetical protein n=1 Tax=Moorena sp. SIOASIH TaxID=2607817 RepID=UPI0025E35E14|nr:hypothetical protein [Moorena sp. SIOASIH]
MRCLEPLRDRIEPLSDAWSRYAIASTTISQTLPFIPDSRFPIPDSRFPIPLVNSLFFH